MDVSGRGRSRRGVVREGGSLGKEEKAADGRGSARACEAGRRLLKGGRRGESGKKNLLIKE